MQSQEIKYIARIYTGFVQKFGIPRQSGLVDSLQGKIIFEPEYRNPDSLRGLEEFSHIWLIWEFSENKRESFSPTVRPPRLGGNERMGVFATRSPFRPNPIGLSCVELEGIEFDTPEGPVIHVRGADLLSGTPIYDIKPYIPYADSRPEASVGFTSRNTGYELVVEIPDELKIGMTPELLSSIEGILSQDPRPAYQRDSERVYGLTYGDCDISFNVNDKLLKVLSIERKC